MVDFNLIFVDTRRLATANQSYIDFLIDLDIFFQGSKNLQIVGRLVARSVGFLMPRDLVYKSDRSIFVRP